MTQQLEFKNLKELMLHLSDEESAAGTWRYLPERWALLSSLQRNQPV